jgi:NADH-ubiquinone oxidoreductase chain 2
LLVPFLTKGAIDVYDDTPTIVTIWLTIMPKISIIIFLLELHSQIGIIGNNVSASLITEVVDLLGGVSSIQTHLVSNGGKIIAENTVYVLKNLLLISSLLSLIIGTVVGLAQSRIKRLFACQVT